MNASTSGNETRSSRRKALRHAAAHDQLLVRPFPQPALLMRLKNRLDRFLLCRIDEGAGVHDQHIGLVGDAA